ncbi:hypothetical protein NKR23_g10237 [Pleurostoma richardsiae]|uniref:F-box domain-containing protein n=1 Tax=Pleurostoma richardsiae TaxID=41990 RepID=A0AA38VEE1_9PEZI|nr:hypothetical protein NKR23_g10237 [Pleurostoma richardsiae]
MDRLPEEIIANIISHVAGDGGTTPPRVLAPYAAMSRRWQRCVEAMTFAHVTLTPARMASPLAAQALTPDRVCRFVRSVRVDILLPPYDEGARARREVDAEKTEADAVFTGLVRRVFALLSPSRGTDHCGGDGRVGQKQREQRPGIDDTTGHRPQIRLSMTARCVSDTEDMEARRYRRNVGATSTEDIFEARYEGSYLDLRPRAEKSVQDEAEALPELHCVSQFHVEATPGSGCRYFAPRALCLMASRMSGLETVHWELCDNEKRDVALRRKLRADFANSLPTLPPTLQHFNLLYDRRLPNDHSFQTRSILDETDQDNDKLSLALHMLSQRLTTFDLIAVVGPEILWPSEPELVPHQQQGDDLPLWSRMRRYTIDPGAIAPSGKWRFRRRLDDYASDSDGGADSYFSAHRAAVTAPGDEKEDPFREELDPDAVGHLLLAAARAAGRMPALRSMFFALDSALGNGSGRLEVSYTANRDKPPAGNDGGGVAVVGAGTAKLHVESHPEFYPDEEVMQAWREAAREHVGAESELGVTIKDSMEW